MKKAASMSVIGRLLDLLLPPRVGTPEYERQETEAAERRWRETNRRKREAGCRCGAPATDVKYHHGNIGSVPVEFWTCAQHVGVSSWSRDGDAPWIARWPQSQPCADCPGTCSTMRKIGAEMPYQWNCPRRAAEDGSLPQP